MFATSIEMEQAVDVLINELYTYTFYKIYTTCNIITQSKRKNLWYRKIKRRAMILVFIKLTTLIILQRLIIILI